MTSASSDPQSPPPHHPPTIPPSPDSKWRALLAAYPWATFVLPLAVFMLVGSLEPTPDKQFELFGLAIGYAAYPAVYTVKIALTMVAMAVVWPGYRQFPLRLSPLAPLVGVVGVVLWIGICKLRLETTLLEPLGMKEVAGFGARAGFNPWEHFADQPLPAYGFLAVRFWGLAILVPVIEEFFLRGFVMRLVVAGDWWNVPFGTLTPAAVVAGTLVPVLMHPAEMLAAAVWFTLVTWLMAKTRNMWDCVTAHAVTNLLLGVYVLASGEWHFW
jgi:CAAX prenyl protease-like protein